MNSKKEKLLNDTYQKWIHTSLYDLPLDGANDFVDPEIMGYGTARDEKVLSISDYRDMVNRQREQAVGLEMSFESTPVFRSISNKEDSAIFVDEIKVSIIFDEGKQELFLRLTSILEYINSKWIVVHLHGSMPTETTAETDTWLVNEWKRKNEELQNLVDEKTSELLNKNRELEIETALEKVRTIAMGMRKPDDMLDVCRIISDQLQSLGVNDIRNVQTALFYETKKTYINFEYYTKHNKSIITEVDYRTHELQELFANKMIKGVEELFSETLRSKEVRDWYEYQKTTNQFADTFLETAESLSYYWYSLGPVALGMSTYIPLNEQEINLFQRFRNVFELAYRRFVDIEKAEEQAREAQIELALERVRAKSLAMLQTSELQAVVNEVAQQLLQMRIDMDGGVIILINDEVDRDVPLWGSAGAADYVQKATVPYLDIPIINRMISAIKKRESFLVERYTKEEKDEFMHHLFRHHPWNKVSQERKNELLYREGGYCRSMSISRHTSIAIINHHGRAFSEADNNILKRFGNVLEQSYTRFLDLQKAEAQAREAQIELALERVRARTMAMQHSEELAETAYVLFQQFKELDRAPKMITIGIVKEKEGVIEFWVTDWGGGGAKVNRKFDASIDEPVLLNKIFTAWKEKKKSITIELAGKELQDWVNYRVKLSGVPDDTDYSDSDGYVVASFFSKGILSLSTYESISEDIILLLERFAGVFDGTYTRFLDLQKAEAQAREAQIEASLERVRSRTMGMQRSDELAETVSVLFKQLLDLGVKSTQLRTCGIVTFKENKPKGEIWITDITGEIIDKAFIAPYDEAPAYKMIYSKWKKGEKFFEINLKGDAFIEHLNFVKKYSAVPNINLDEIQKMYSEIFFHVLFFSQGYLFIISYEPLPEYHDIFKRFGALFQQTYTRFLDFKKVEAQAREAKIETALERTRTQSMIMQHSKELDDTLRVFHEQVLLLGINSAFSYLWLPDEEKDRHIFWAAWGEDKNNSMVFKSKAINYPLDRNEPATAQCLVDWRSHESLYSYQVPPDAVENYFAAWQELIDGVEQLKPEYFSGGLYYVEAFMKYGCFGVMVATDLTEDEKKILGRLAIEFERTYTRFLDLQKAEAQTREANIETSLERVRSKAMAMHSPNDLSETVNVFFKELKALGIIPIRCGVGQIDGATRTTSLTTTTSSQQGESFQVIGKIKQTGHPVLDGIFDHWKLQKEYHPVLEGEDIKNYYNVMNAQIGYPEYPEGVTQFGNCFFFKEGFVFAWTESKLSEEELQIFRRFTFVLSLTYRRYIDLKEAEARAREAMMQSSLDRLRAEIAGMRSAEDLQYITPLIWHELLTLDVPFIRCGVFIVDEERENVQVYLSTPDGHSLGVLNLSFDANELTSNTVRHWQKKTVYTEHWNKEQFINWMQSMIEIGQIPNTKSYQGADDPPESLNLHFVPFAQGMLYVGNTTPLTNEKIQLVKSLADAFSIAFTRYEDFKNLEEAKNRVEITLTELKSAQAQLVQAEKLASLGQLTAGIAHEIKNPLNFVNNFSEISSELLDEMKIELQNDNKVEAIAIAEDIKQNLEKINQHGKRADSIVKGMLLHSRGSAGEKSLTNINDLLDQYVNLAYHGLRAQNKEFNITIQKDFDESLEKINVVPQDISRVFLNIVNNGFYAANEKKKKSENEFAPILKVSTKNLPDKVEIIIRDNGNGIPQSIKNNIFNPFFTTKPTGEGTGLGLSLSYDIITKVHNGEIIFDTKENEFTEFTITIPKFKN
jgi:signal transduction histidine kinase